MSIQVKRFQKAKGAILFLEELAFRTNGTVVFRGQCNSKYKLVTTWQRHRSIPHEEWMPDIDQALEQYRVGLEKIGVASPNHLNRVEAMEHGRHHGLPTPCLDFSYSPYVALFFAFDGVRKNFGRTKNTYSVIYALNVNQLASEWAKDKSINHFASPKFDSDKLHSAYRRFLDDGEGFAEKKFPSDILQFIPFPGKSNSRMQKQLGALLYDTLDYERLGIKCLEDYIAQMTSTPESEGGHTKPGEPILHKLLINQNCVGDVFQRLELMNMNGATLYGDANGVALDVKNTYNYNPKFSYLRDIETAEIDDTSTG